VCVDIVGIFLILLFYYFVEQDEDSEESEDDELAFVQNHLYENDSEDEGPNDYKFSDFFLPAKGSSSKKNSAGKANKVHLDVGEEDDEPEDDGDDDDESVADEDDDNNDDDYVEEDEDEEFSGSELADSIRGKNNDSGFKGSDDKPREKKPTTVQRRNEALSSQIAALEGELVESKPWELRGEVKASDRPENSFLSLHADIER
jgi:U3 small nucleolar RNA-associated protein MPP10